MSSIEHLVYRQLRKWELEKQKRESEPQAAVKPLPIITVSRMRGSRGSYLAQRLAEQLGYQLVHREIIDHIANSSGLRRRLIESLDERPRNQIELWLEGIFKGPYADASDYFRHLYSIIIAMSRLGGVIVVGRGANYVLTLRTGFHLRVVAARAARESNLVKYEKMSEAQARAEVEREDAARQAFIKANFKRNIDDPEYYDLVLNTNYIDIEDALAFVKRAIEAKLTKLQHLT